MTGVASNIAIALSRLQHYPAFITAIGDDSFAESIRAHLQAQELVCLQSQFKFGYCLIEIAILNMNLYSGVF